ncbi:MAG: hypothetical protein V4702_01735 [Patescibacteria group bacterium]
MQKTNIVAKGPERQSGDGHNPGLGESMQAATLSAEEYRALSIGQRLATAGTYLSGYLDTSFSSNDNGMPDAGLSVKIPSAEPEEVFEAKVIYRQALWQNGFGGKLNIKRHPTLRIFSPVLDRSIRKRKNYTPVGEIELVPVYISPVDGKTGGSLVEPLFFVDGRSISAEDERAAQMVAIVDEAVCGLLPEE